MSLTKQQVVDEINRANAHARAGRFREAAQAYLPLIKLRPRDPELLRRLAVVEANLTWYGEALRHIEKASKLSPRDAQLHLAMGWIAVQAGDSDRAVDAYTRAEYFDPGNIEARWGIAAVHEKRHELDKAEQWVDKVLADEPNSTQAAIIKARLHRRRGELDEARELLERVEHAGGVAPNELHGLLYELGRIRDKQRDYDGAFDAISRANRAHAELPESKAFDADRPFRLIEDFMAITPEQFARWGSASRPDDVAQPLFLVAVPRSGTTMTEQVLAAHPAIFGTGETPVLRDVRSKLADLHDGEPSERVRLDLLDLDDIASLRSVYQTSAQQILKGTGKRILLDKLPLQIMSLPVISRILPDARVIVAVRDPRDVCLSCYFQEFAPNNSMINFFDLERTARLYDAVMGMYLAHREHYAFRALEVRYEDTTADPEAQARRLLDLAGVEWDERVLGFHERRPDRFVNTPSYEAVTEPVHRKAVGRWRRYERHLEPILPILEPFIEAFGYEPSAS